MRRRSGATAARSNGLFAVALVLLVVAPGPWILAPALTLGLRAGAVGAGVALTVVGFAFALAYSVVEAVLRGRTRRRARRGVKNR